MSRITCSKSSIVFNVEHMPMGLSSDAYYHPLFSVSQKRLLNLTKEWAANKLSPTEAYLLYLALLNSTDLLIWRSSARFTDKTISIIQSNMEHLIQIVGKINLIKHPHFTLSKIAITYDTGDLRNSFYWIQSWLHGYNEFMSDFIDVQKREELKVRVERRENSLAKLIKDENATPEKLANNLAEWAEDACDFPTYKIKHPLTGDSVGIQDFWKEIIRACVREDRIWRYGEGQVDKLIEHCEENLQEAFAGTIYSHALMKLLRAGLKKIEDYTGFGDVDLMGKRTSFQLLNPNTSVEDANIIAAVQAAPAIEPKRENYPSLGSYLKAKLNWDMAQNMKGRM